MGLYSTISSSNSSEMIAEKIKAQAAERAAFGNSVLAEVQGPFYSGGSEKDVFVCKDGCDDGRISFSEKVSNFCNGIVAPIKNIFASPKNMAVTALTVAAGAGLIALTGGAAAPVMVALGVIGGGTQIASGLYKQATATTDAQAAQAWNQMGSGTFTMGISALGAKSSLKVAGVQNTANMTTWQAVCNCIKNAPSFFSKAVSTASPKVAAFIASIKTGKTPKAPNTPNAQTTSNHPRLDAFKKKLGLNKGEPKVTVEPKVKPKKSSGANQPRVIELPEVIVDSENKTSVKPSFTQEEKLGLPTQQERLALPPAKPQYKINYTTEEYFPQNVLMPAQSKPQAQPQSEILGLPAPQERLALPPAKPQYKINYTTEEYFPQNIKMPGQKTAQGEILGLPAPKAENITIPKSSGGMKAFLINVGNKIKESLNLFGIFIK